MNSSTFSKTTENVRRRIIVRLVNNVGDYKEWVSKPRILFHRKDFVKILLVKLTSFDTW